MIVHSYYYGPRANGLTLETTTGLTNVVNEDLIRALYSEKGSPSETVEFSNVHNTLHGPVLAITRITPTQARDRRATVENRSIFIRLSDIVEDAKKLLDKPADNPVKLISAEIVRR